MRKSRNEYILFCDCGPRELLHIVWQWPSEWIRQDGSKYLDDGYLCIGLQPPDLGNIWARIKYALTYIFKPRHVRWHSDILLDAIKDENRADIHGLIEFLEEGLVKSAAGHKDGPK